MEILETKYIALRCKQTKVLLDGVVYKRFTFEKSGEPLTVQWMKNGDYVDDTTEKILEKIFSEIESD
jgi:hypothetical protein